MKKRKSVVPIVGALLSFFKGYKKTGKVKFPLEKKGKGGYKGFLVFSMHKGRC
jgi:hypothetical protein